MLTNIEGIKYRVDLSSAKAHREHPEAWAMSSFHCFIRNGGFCATKLSDGSEEPVICALTDVISMLTKEETMAMLLHEEAHIVHGDLDTDAMKNAEPGTVLNDQKAELRADLYSAERVGAFTVYSALNKTLKKQAKLLCEEFGESPEDHWAFIRDSIELTERFDALHALIATGGPHAIPREIWTPEKTMAMLKYIDHVEKSKNAT